MVYFIPFGRAIFLYTDSLFAQKVLLTIKCTVGNIPNCGRWCLNSRQIVDCKENPQIPWHLLLSIARRHLGSLVICQHHAVFDLSHCVQWNLPHCTVSWTCTLFGVSRIFLHRNRVVQTRWPISLELLLTSLKASTPPNLPWVCYVFAWRCSPHSETILAAKQLIDETRHFLYIITSYFVPKIKIRKAMSAYLPFSNTLEHFLGTEQTCPMLQQSCTAALLPAVSQGASLSLHSSFLAPYQPCSWPFFLKAHHCPTPLNFNFLCGPSTLTGCLHFNN